MKKIAKFGIALILAALLTACGAREGDYPDYEDYVEITTPALPTPPLPTGTPPSPTPAPTTPAAETPAIAEETDFTPTMPIAEEGFSLPVRRNTISAGYTLSAAIMADGGVYTWGGTYGEPTRTSENMAAIRAFTLWFWALDHDGGLWGFSQHDGEKFAIAEEIADISGDGIIAKNGNLRNSPPMPPITQFMFSIHTEFLWQLRANHIIDMAEFGEQRLFLSHDNSLWGAGLNLPGIVHEELHGFHREMVHIMDDVAQISAGSNHLLILMTDGRLYTWGANHRGQLGIGNFSPNSDSHHILDNVAAIEAVADSSFAITTAGALYAWGANNYGQLGNGEVALRQTTPVPIMQGIAAVSAGYSHTLALSTTGRLYAWGDNEFGQLGNNTTQSRPYPVFVMDGVELP
ncbi:MAG: hypothetical protein LBE35_10830 [Clostridiales bacterium]|jgi:alpha-tubulin suppressor-like RCC1 family protein|nr:hypothetical protein [Clostridiales bacterium]